MIRRWLRFMKCVSSVWGVPIDRFSGTIHFWVQIDNNSMKKNSLDRLYYTLKLISHFFNFERHAERGKILIERNLFRLIDTIV